MLLLFSVYADVAVTGDELTQLVEKTQKEVKEVITGKKNSAASNRGMIPTGTEKTPSPHFKGAKISISQDGAVANTSAAEMRQTREEIERHQPILVPCRNSGDIFGPKEDKLRDPEPLQGK